MIPQTARMVGRGLEFAAECVHLCKRRDLARVAEIVRISAARHGWAGSGLHGDEIGLCLAGQPILHEGRNQAAEIRAAARATDDDIRIFLVERHGLLRLQADHRLVQEHLIEHRAKHIARARCGHGLFHGLRDRAAERAAGAGEFLKNFAPDLCRVTRAGDDIGAKGFDDRFAVGLLMEARLDHINGQGNVKIRARHGQRRAPLAGPRLGGQACQALLFGIIGLRDGRIELMAAGGVIALEFAVDLCGRAQFLFEIVGADERRGTEGFVIFHNLIGDIDIAGCGIKLLLCKLLAEDRIQLFELEGLHRPRVQKWSGLLLHIGSQIIPLPRDPLFR